MSRKKKTDESVGGVSRRGFLKGAGFAVAAVGAGSMPVQGQGAQAGDENVTILGDGETKVSLTVNGEKVETTADPGTTLLDMIRNNLDMTGTKRVCDRGSCGACTVILDGRAVCSCSYLAMDAQGKSVQTVEGLAQNGKLSKLQSCFVECDALQCGFCTPGMLMASTAFLNKNKKPTRDEIRDGIAGNICRCGTYQNIFEAVEKASAGGGK